MYYYTTSSNSSDSDNLTDEQLNHLKSIEDNYNSQPCLHDGCQECHGTGRKHNGALCFHMISCPCPKCSPRCCAL